MHKVSVFALALISPLVLASPAAAQFRLCNETKQPVRAAIGHNDGAGWRSQGWYLIPAGGCRTLLKDPLVARYYYLFAVHQNIGGGWNGDRYFCVAQSDFTIDGRTQCEERGYKAAGFYEVDTGEDSTWTSYLDD
ncbi:MAG: DUF1036 domain-containing protein [Alphaproteobacteria bacterium]|nr:DUF1036 domain-containing protein [Alphaproteobacteria bacterium]